MEDVIQFLECTKKYNQLLSRWRERQNEHIRFEVLFAFHCESNGLTLNYEVEANLENDKTVDFGFETDNGVNVNIELVRPDLNQALKAQINSSGELQGYFLTSNDKDPNFRTCAQLIKLQWGLLEKVHKFSEINAKTINIIVVDCSNVHAGMFDRHDLEMAMYGRSSNPIWQEYWEGNKLLGMWEKGYNQRNSDIFCSRISTVFFVPKQSSNILKDAMAAINPLQTHDYRVQMFEVMKGCKAYINVKVVQ